MIKVARRKKGDRDLGERVEVFSCEERRRKRERGREGQLLIRCEEGKDRAKTGRRR